VRVLPCVCACGPLNSLPRVRDEGVEWVALGSRLDGQSHRTTQRREMGIERGLGGVYARKGQVGQST
jgi:hypothetical protein